MNLREHTRLYVEKDNRLAALSYFGTFAVYFTSLWAAITFVGQWYVLGPAVLIHAFAAVQGVDGRHEPTMTLQRSIHPAVDAAQPDLLSTGGRARGAGLE